MTTPERQEAAAALLQALRDVADANDRLQLAAAWALEAFGDSFDAETVRMLRIPGGPARGGRPPVPGSVTSDESPAAEDYDERQQHGSIDVPDEAGTLRHGIGMPEWMAKIVDRERGRGDVDQ